MATASHYKIRWGWLRFMYIYTIVVAGLIGLGDIIAPSAMQATLCMPEQDPFVFGLTASFLLAVALLAILGLRAPLKYSPILFFELLYKLIWLFAVVLPAAFQCNFPFSACVQTIIFVTFIIGELIAIPFKYIFDRDVALGTANVEVVDYH